MKSKHQTAKTAGWGGGGRGCHSHWCAQLRIKQNGFPSPHIILVVYDLKGKGKDQPSAGRLDLKVSCGLLFSHLIGFVLPTTFLKRCFRCIFISPQWLVIIFAILLSLILCFVFSKANTDVKENKENEKKADPLKEPPLEPDALSRVGTVIFNPFANGFLGHRFQPQVALNFSPIVILVLSE